MPLEKTYLGDAVYAVPSQTGGVILSVEYGEGPPDTIILDPDVLLAFMAFIERMRAEP